MQVLTTTEEVSTKPGSGWAGILSPSLPDIYFAVVILWLFLGGGGKSLLSDGDTGWHIRTGDYILQHHAVPANPVEQSEALQDPQPIRLDEYPGADFAHGAVALVHVHPPAVHRKCDRRAQAGNTASADDRCAHASDHTCV